MPSPSPEQKEVIAAIERGENIKIIATAGAGKTTTIIQLAQAFPQKKFLVLLYNRQLSRDTTERLKSYGITNLHVHTYHGLGVQHYNGGCINDTGLIRTIKNKLLPKKPLSFDVLCLDEQQDMTQILYHFVSMVISHNTKNIDNNTQLVLVGDPNQEIYEYNGASHLFLTIPHKLFTSNRPWHTIHHNTTYRFGTGIASFLNQFVPRPPPFNQEILVGRPTSNDQPVYLICDFFESHPYIDYLLKSTPHDQILFLAPSISSSFMQNFANKIATQTDGKVYIAKTDFDHFSAAGKIIFCTFHQAKGIEREVVIMSFDSSYNNFYSHGDGSMASNAQYVALTRAKKTLVLVQHISTPPAPFLDLKKISSTCKIIGTSSPLLDSKAQSIKNQINEPHAVAVTNLVKHLPELVSDQVFDCANFDILKGTSKTKKKVNDLMLVTEPSNSLATRKYAGKSREEV